MKVPPDFLDRGTFEWDELGYTLPDSAPRDLLTRKAAESGDPWIALASALEHAKVGNRSHVGRLARWISMDASELFLRGAMSLIADAGSLSDLDTLERLMLDGDDYLRIEACWAARHAGLLRLVPSMAYAYVAVRRASDRSSIGAMFGAVIGDDLHWVLDYDDMEPRDYASLVEHRVHELEAADLARVHVQNGHVFSVKDHAETLLRSLKTGGQSTALEDTFLRRKFEATTGVDCRSFYAREHLRPLAAAAIVEGFLDSGEADRYEPGARYFFGHRIPD